MYAIRRRPYVDPSPSLFLHSSIPAQFQLPWDLCHRLRRLRVRPQHPRHMLLQYLTLPSFIDYSKGFSQVRPDVLPAKLCRHGTNAFSTSPSTLNKTPALQRVYGNSALAKCCARRTSSSVTLAVIFKKPRSGMLSYSLPSHVDTNLIACLFLG